MFIAFWDCTCSKHSMIIAFWGEIRSLNGRPCCLLPCLLLCLLPASFSCLSCSPPCFFAYFLCLPAYLSLPVLLCFELPPLCSFLLHPCLHPPFFLFPSKRAFLPPSRLRRGLHPASLLLTRLLPPCVRPLLLLSSWPPCFRLARNYLLLLIAHPPEPREGVIDTQ